MKNGLTKLPCFLKILASWGDFFDNGLLLYPVQDHTMQCCTRKPFWVAKPEPQSCSASASPYFKADAELGVMLKLSNRQINHKDNVFLKILLDPPEFTPLFLLLTTSPPSPPGSSCQDFQLKVAFYLGRCQDVVDDAADLCNHPYW